MARPEVLTYDEMLLNEQKNNKKEKKKEEYQEEDKYEESKKKKEVDLLPLQAINSHLARFKSFKFAVKGNYIDKIGEKVNDYASDYFIYAPFFCDTVTFSDNFGLKGFIHNKTNFCDLYLSIPQNSDSNIVVSDNFIYNRVASIDNEYIKLKQDNRVSSALLKLKNTSNTECYLGLSLPLLKGKQSTKTPIILEFKIRSINIGINAAKRLFEDDKLAKWQQKCTKQALLDSLATVKITPQNEFFQVELEEFTPIK